MPYRGPFAPERLPVPFTAPEQWRHSLTLVATVAQVVQLSVDLSPTVHVIASVVLTALAAYGITPRTR